GHARPGTGARGSLSSRGGRRPPPQTRSGAGSLAARGARMSQDLLILCHEVHKTYQGRRRLTELILPSRGDGHAIRALDGVSFRLERGRVLGIAGESGSGKSTLANLLVGLERPSGGLIRIGHHDVAGLRGRALLAFRRQVQMVFQDPFASLNPRFTVRRTVEEPLIIHGIGSRAERFARAAEALAEADLRPPA